MLDELEVINYALIEKASIEFATGFTVLTGETGAGKTALVGAIKLLIGERADVGAISDGADELRVSARLVDVAEVDELIVMRRVSRSGRSRASINDEMATVSALAERIGVHFDLLGQHEHQSLLSSSAQLRYLDRCGGAGIAVALADYQEAWRLRQAAADELAMLQAASSHGAANFEQARYTVEQIAAVAVELGEYEQLTADLPILRRSEDLALSSEAALEMLRTESAALDLLAQASRAMSAVKGIDPRLDSLLERLDSASIDLEDIASELVAYRDSVSFDSHTLEATLDRLGQLDGLMRRFSVLRIEDVIALRDAASEQLAIADNLPERLAAAAERLEVAETKLAACALQLNRLRDTAASELSERLTARLAELAFSGAAIEAECEELPREQWTSTSAARFELTYRPQPRSSARPLARIASGGELSRVMLALKSELIESEGMTLVFDEVDAGIGGAAASAVALYIKQLSQVHQVIAVTHLAQIAAQADRHYVVERQSGDEGSGTLVYEVEGEARVRELARMLSGSTDKAALAHARELLK